MAVLHAEGFSAVPRASTPFSTTALLSLGYTPKVLYNGTLDATATSSYQLAVAADPTFGDRSRITMLVTQNAYTWVASVKKNLDTRGFGKFVIGCVCRSETVGTTLTTQLIISGPTAFTSSNALTADAFAVVTIPNDGTTKGTIAFGTGTAVAIDVVKGQEFHVEILVEDDVDRVRVYVDGILKLDNSWTGTFAQQAGGVTLSSRLPAVTANTAAGGAFSNFYVLGVDAVHTGILGAAARVLEIAPPGDMDVHWKRPDSYATNAAVMAQMFNSSSPDYLAASVVGDYDVYSAPSAVAANAVQVFGAGMKINAMTMAAGSHTLKPVVKTATGVHEVGTEAALQLGTLTPIFVDASVNPDTNAIWTPSALTASGFGMKLKS